MGKTENNGVIDTKVPFFKELINIIDNEVIKNIDNKIQSIYENWNSENLSGEKSEAVIIKKELLRHENQKIPIDEVKLLGIDLPSWYGDYNSKNKIMIIGIDPMRSSNNFKLASADETKDILIGTPYGYHIKKLRNNKKNKNYTQFINSFINDNNFIYLTDIYKTFFYYTGIENKNIRSYEYYGQQQKLKKIDEENSIRNSILKTLCSEIYLINPTIIITLGDISFNQLTCKSVEKNSESAITPQFFYEDIFKDYRHIPIYPFMHLKAWDANLLKFISQYIPENDSKDFGNLFFEIVKKYDLILSSGFDTTSFK
jgi:hypothetical protein